MVWIDEVRRFDANGGVCAVELEAGAPYLGVDGLRRSSLIEMMAQAHGFLRAARQLQNPKEHRVQRAFLASIRDAVFQPHSPSLGSTLLVTIQNERQLGSLTMFTGTVRTDAGQELAGASLTVFSQ